MAAKGAAVTVAAKEEVAREEAAVAEETVSGTCVVRQGASRQPRCMSCPTSSARLAVSVAVVRPAARRSTME